MPTPSWQEMRDRATRFTLRWRDETRERAEKDSFWNDFFAIFDIDRRRVAVFEHLSSRHSTRGRGFMDVFWPGYVAAEHKSRGADLSAAMNQALDYLPTIPPEHLPRLVVVSDFARFRVLNQLTGEQVTFPITELAANLHAFAPMLDVEVHRYATEEDVNLKATELLALLHDSLKASGYDGHPLRVLLVRLVFVMFADDTQVWEPGLFYDYLMLRTSVDGHDLGPALIHLFQVLDTAKDRRSKHLDDDLARFEYINGALFHESIPIPDCTRGMRERLLKACRFDWSKISPAIFGSLFQNVMEAEERRRLGAHYTTEQNILRTIAPLFLDELRAELDAARGVAALRRFRDRLATLTFFDPACGCGNFLIIAYREIRRIELECLRRIRAEEEREAAKGSSRYRAGGVGRNAVGAGQLGMDVTIESKVNVGQLYGIEVEEFPARIAETAVYLIDHLENLALSAEFGSYYARFPITDSAHIKIGNALRESWDEVLPPDQCTYLFGNPPFVGISLRSPEQTADLKAVWQSQYHGSLDYVTGWYRKAIDYACGSSTRTAFVSTNSICQGEQVAPLWAPVFNAGLRIDFAHRTFAWTSEAKGKAAVHCVIVGLGSAGNKAKPVLYYYDHPRGEPTPQVVSQISPYLFPGPPIVVRPLGKPLNPDLGDVAYGSKPTDGGNFIVEREDYDEVVADPIAAKYVRPFIGARELLYDEQRWCLWLTDVEPSDVRNSTVLRKRIEGVREFRAASKAASTRAAAATPTLFRQIGQPDTSYLAIPSHSSEARDYFPVQRYGPEVICSNANFLTPDPDGMIFALMSSALFMTWLRTVGGTLKSDLRFNKFMVWNTFPVPHLSEQQRRSIVQAGEHILEVRQSHDTSSLAVLYDRTAMPVALSKAHRSLDRVLGAVYGLRDFTDITERQNTLFKKHVELSEAGALPGTSGRKATSRKRV